MKNNKEILLALEAERDNIKKEIAPFSASAIYCSYSPYVNPFREGYERLKEIESHIIEIKHCDKPTSYEGGKTAEEIIANLHKRTLMIEKVSEDDKEMLLALESQRDNIRKEIAPFTVATMYNMHSPYMNQFLEYYERLKEIESHIIEIKYGHKPGFYGEWKKAEEIKAHIPQRTLVIQEASDDNSFLPQLPTILCREIAEYEGGIESPLLGQINDSSEGGCCTIS